MSIVTAFSPTETLKTLLEILSSWNIIDKRSVAYNIKQAFTETLYQPFPIVSCLHTISMCLKKLSESELEHVINYTPFALTLSNVLASAEVSVRKASYECLVECILANSTAFWSVSKSYLSLAQEQMVSIMAENTRA